MLFILIIAMVIYVFLPLPAEAVIFIINCFLPDPIPYADEIFMILTAIGKMKRLNKGE